MTALIGKIIAYMAIAAGWFCIMTMFVPALVSAKSTLAVIAGFALLALCVATPIAAIWRWATKIGPNNNEVRINEEPKGGS